MRYANRPARYSLRDFVSLGDRPGARWGRIAMPTELIAQPLAGSRQSDQVESSWNLIEPVLNSFEQRDNLRAANFSALIRARSQAKDVSYDTVKRLVLRYYYFGGTKNALVPFLRGVKPGSRADGAGEYTQEKAPAKRRGRKSIRTQILGENKFIVSEADIADMVSSLRRQLRNAKTGYKQAWKSYLANEFARRNKKVYQQYINKEIDLPVTERQYYYYLTKYAELDSALSENLVTRTRESGYRGALTANAPGDIYEIDATGGRLHLLAGNNPPILVDRPNIYLLIDRWSRYVVSVYISLRPASYEELRYALLIGFTSRNSRFKAMRCNVDDERWPVGRVPIRIVADRGSEFLSNAIEQSLSTDLRIKLTNLPPLCPDGKAIVERFIRTMKQKMLERGMSGVYAERPMNPVTKRAKEKAESAPLTSLSEAYRELVQIVIEYNNTPHTTLKNYRELTQAGIAPTPQQAYLWGIKNKASKGVFPYSEEELAQIFLSPDTATMSHGKITYKRNTYHPSNDLAHALVRDSGARAKKVSIRVDRTYPQSVYVSSKRGDRAEFGISANGADTLGLMTLDEEDAMEHETKLRWAMSSHQSNIDQIDGIRQRASRTELRQSAPKRAERSDRERTQAARKSETEQQKELLMGRERHSTNSFDSDDEPEWLKQKRKTEAAHLELVAKMREKK